MKNGKVIIIFMCVLVLLYCIGCNNNNNNNNNEIVASDNNLYEPKTTLEKKSKENIEEYEIKANIIYYVFTDEYIENNDEKNPNISQFTRQFICYNGVKNWTYPYTNIVFLDNILSIQQCREYLSLHDPNELKLKPNTIVSTTVLKKWESQDYDGSSSYSDESPKGLTYFDITSDNTSSESDEHINPYNYEDLSSLPENYTLEMAEKNNNVVWTFNNIANLELLDNFKSNVQNGIKDMIRIVSFTTEGDCIIKDLEYNGTVITLTHDFTRDEYSSNPSVQKYEFDSIVIENRYSEHYKGTFIEYFLKKESDDSSFMVLQIFPGSKE